MFTHDARIIQRHGEFQIHAQRHEVMFRDGSAVHLHPVALADGAGVCDTFLRAVNHEGLRWIVFDLRQLSPEIQADILRLQPRDTPGVVFYTLRQTFGNAVAMLARVQQCAAALWWQTDLAAAA